ncbi:MAG: macro domain-containing protein, partial [Betaproteobacteria bacterium]
YRLRARYVIHTVGPVWQGGAHHESERLASCYRRCIEIAAQHGLKTLAFSSVSTGVYGYPIDLAAGVAVATVRASVPAHHTLEHILFCCFSTGDLAVYQRILGDSEP